MASLLLLDLYVHLQVKIVMSTVWNMYISIGRALCKIGVLA